MARAQQKTAPFEKEISDQPPVPPSKRRLDQLDTSRLAAHLVSFRPSESQLRYLWAKATDKVPGIAPVEEALKIAARYPDCVFAVARKSRFNPADPQGEGFIIFLPLNMLGLQHLALSTINAAQPNLHLLAKPGERPAALYLWLVFAPGPLAGAIAVMMERFSTEQYAGIDIYARTVTEDGKRISRQMGLTQGITIGEIEAPNVWIFPRRVPPPLYDSYVPGAEAAVIGITVARQFEDLMKVAAIRNAVHIGEQQSLYDEEYDGNDLTATHLLAYEGDEPAGCIRLRYFADFAKLERLVIRKEFRKSASAVQLVAAAVELCRKKGYRRIYAHSQIRLVGFWQRFGFRVMENARHFTFAGLDYVEILLEPEPDSHGISLSSGPYLLMRPEGRWHVRSKSEAPPPAYAGTAQRAK